jgi:hypothetical protein
MNYKLYFVGCFVLVVNPFLYSAAPAASTASGPKKIGTLVRSQQIPGAEMVLAEFREGQGRSLISELEETSRILIHRAIHSDRSRTVVLKFIKEIKKQALEAAQKAHQQEVTG